MKELRSFFFVVAGGLLATMSSTAGAQALPQDVIDLFVQLGIPLDENGDPLLPPVTSPPKPPAEPINNEELAALLGIPVEVLNGEPLPPTPEPDTPPQPVVAITPEELAEMLGLPVELFLEPTAEVDPTPPVPEPELPIPSTGPPITDQELAELLRIPYEQLFPTDIVQPSSNPEPAVSIEEIFAELGLATPLPQGMAMTPAQSAAVASFIAVPEPSGAALVLIVAGLVGRRRENR